MQLFSFLPKCIQFVIVSSIDAKSSVLTQTQNRLRNGTLQKQILSQSHYNIKEKKLETRYVMTKGSSSEKCSRISGVSSKSAEQIKRMKHMYYRGLDRAILFNKPNILPRPFTPEKVVDPDLVL